MKRLQITLICALLTGCTVGTSLADLVAQVQTKTVELCQYLPQANAVAAMLTAANPTAVGVGAIANAICTAVIQWKSQPKNTATAQCPTVNGVCVEGEFK
jgi:hypothetical protein